MSAMNVPARHHFKLYSEPDSPFSAPVRIAIYAKDLPIEILPPPGGLRSSVYHRINPIGTIPCLARDDGFLLPESAAILEYLDDIFPQPALRPDDPDTRARMRLFQRIGELGIMTTCVELLQMMRQNAGDIDTRGARLTRLVRSLASLDVFLTDEPYAIGQSFSLADCQLGPALSIVPAVAEAYGTGNLIKAYPGLERYFETCKAHPAVRRVLAEMTAAQT